MGEQIDALEAWIDYHRSDGRIGALAPAMIGSYPRVAPGVSRLPPVPDAKVQARPIAKGETTKGRAPERLSHDRRPCARRRSLFYINGP